MLVRQHNWELKERDAIPQKKPETPPNFATLKTDEEVAKALESRQAYKDKLNPLDLKKNKKKQ